MHCTDAPTIPIRRVSSIKICNPPIASALLLLLLLAAQSIFVLWSTLAALYYAVSVHSKEDPPASISRHPPSQREPALKSTKYLFIWRTGLSLIKSICTILRQLLKGQTVKKAWIFWEYYSRSQDNLNWRWLSLRTSFLSQENPRPLGVSSQAHVTSGPRKAAFPFDRKSDSDGHRVWNSLFDVSITSFWRFS